MPETAANSAADNRVGERNLIPARFAYHRPSSIADAVGLLSRYGDEGRALAGGHSLIPAMKLRMAVPGHLVDLGGIAALRGVREEGDTIVIGAMTTQAELIRSELLATRLPILREAARQIADPQVRSRGTLGGNVANGDPGNDMPALMLCLAASYVLAGPAGERTVPARGFYQGAYMTEMRPDELLTALRIPVPPRGHGHAYEKLKRKVGDYATAAAAVVLTMAAGRVNAAAIALTNLAPTPLLAEEAAAIVAGATLDAATVRRATEAAMAITDPTTDSRGTAEYRRSMAGVVVTRALAKAAARATGGVA